MKEILGGKLLWALTIAAGGFTATLSPEEWRIFLGATASLLTAIAGGLYKWHMRDMKKRRRLNGEQGKGETCKEDKD